MLYIFLLLVEGRQLPRKSGGGTKDFFVPQAFYFFSGLLNSLLMALL